MKTNRLILALVILLFTAVSCQRNYYSSKAKKSDCGCPAKKGMVGY